jgi:hypothetical protein
MCRFSNRLRCYRRSNSTQRKRPLERLSYYPKTRYRSLRVISPRSRRGFIDVVRFKTHGDHRCYSPIFRAAFNALTGARTQGPRAKRFLRGFLRISATVNTIIATLIPEMAEYGSRSARHRHALDLAPKQVITLVPPIAQRARATLGSSRSTPKLAARPQYRDFETREAFG